MAATDPDQIIASAIGFELTENIWDFLSDYFSRESVESVVLGYPTNWNGEDNDATPLVREFKEKFAKRFPTKPIVLHDESFTSKMASEAMVSGGMKKKKRREKGNVDAVAATLILQSYMETR